MVKGVNKGKSGPYFHDLCIARHVLVVSRMGIGNTENHNIRQSVANVIVASFPRKE